MARCEDFPCCGHYDPRTGETYCREATMSEEEREIAAAEKRHEEELRQIRRRHERERDMASRKLTCFEALEAAPETWVEASQFSKFGQIRGLIKAFWDAKTDPHDVEGPTYTWLKSVVPLDVIKDEVYECHEDGHDTDAVKDSYKACGPCTAEWEAESENARRDEEYVFGAPDSPYDYM